MQENRFSRTTHKEINIYNVDALTFGQFNKMSHINTETDIWPLATYLYLLFLLSTYAILEKIGFTSVKNLHVCSEIL
jgi:hypothetical protein